MNNLEQLGIIVQTFRDKLGLSQDEYAKKLNLNRTTIALFEQGRRLPSIKNIKLICEDLNIPNLFWEKFISSEDNFRNSFENILSELIGINVNLDNLTKIERDEANKHINELFKAHNNNQVQTFDNFNRCLIFYGIPKITYKMFERYFQNAFLDINSFIKSVEKYQEEAIRIFSTFNLAYKELNSSEENFDNYIKQLEKKTLDSYSSRNEWNSIVEIKDTELPFLGYIAAEKVETESIERNKLIEYLKDISTKLKAEEHINREKMFEHGFSLKTINKIDTLLRKFGSKIEHGFASSLLTVDLDLINREIKRLAPKEKQELLKMGTVQKQAFANLTNYLTADYMDLYVATSMRLDGDFISVNSFINKLINHSIIKPLKLRYFNPTQSWIEDRVSKGLVEALMLKRADITLYMAQKTDTFGKDSEASVSLGQGKPVLVYIPKLTIPELENFDSEVLFNLKQEELEKRINEQEHGEFDKQSLMSILFTEYMNKATDELIIKISIDNWAEFDIESEEYRIDSMDEKTEYREFIEQLKNKIIPSSISSTLRKNLQSIFIALTINYEKRAKVFKEVHPLALQVILSTGVLNGILVSRTLDSCAFLLSKLIENNLDLELIRDENNYKLVEKTTKSVIRVISKNIVLGRAFEQFFKYKR